MVRSRLLNYTDLKYRHKEENRGIINKGDKREK